MNIIIKQISMGMLVRLLINSAAPVAKLDATRMPVSTIRIAMILWTVVPKYFEIIFGIVSPLFLKDINPEKKSWIPPMNIVPNTIHRNTAGPNSAPVWRQK